jgi:outer membrane protein, heavy metal efflux system
VFRQLLLLSGLILPLCGCTWAVRESTDQTVRDFTAHPFDIAPELKTEAPRAQEQPQPAGATPGPLSDAQPKSNIPAMDVARKPDQQRPTQTETDGWRKPDRRGGRAPEVATDVQTAAWLESQSEKAPARAPQSDGRLVTVAWGASQAAPGANASGTAPLELFGPQERTQAPGQPKLELHISPRLPGSEAPPIEISPDRRVAERQIDALYPELPPLPVEPKVQPGPGGKPYTLADFQRLAAANSPTLRQAASDIEAARGNLIQAGTYPNPTTGYFQDTSANNNTGGVESAFISQTVITGGKQTLGVAAAQKDLDNAILALKRARSDLSTAVRNAYFTVLVDVETLIVTRAQAQFSDDVYRLQVGLLRGTQAAPYEPTALRAQTYTNRLAYKQAIASYIYDWKALVATLGLPQLPLSEIAGRVDRFIPYYDYDEVRRYMLRHHTDMLTARNGVKKAQYLLKIQQITPLFPNLNAYWSLQRDFVNYPHGTYSEFSLGFPLAIFDQNKGNIIAAQGALVRASKEMHRVEVTLTNSLATAYEGYRNNLYAMEYYRRDVLPHLVRYYRGVFARRQIDPTSAFGDLVFAQQNLSSNITSYIGVLGSLWASVVNVADFLQTDDLFQVAQRREVPELPDFNGLAHWAHDHVAQAIAAANPSGLTEATLAHPSAGTPPARAAGAAVVEPESKATGTPPAAVSAPPPGGERPPGAATDPPGDATSARLGSDFAALMRAPHPGSELWAKPSFAPERSETPADSIAKVAFAKDYIGRRDEEKE